MPDLSALDLNLLKALDALVDEQSVTRAATRLGLSQPALSATLARLRESFGDPLFMRAQRGIIPTARALELSRQVKQILKEIEGLLAAPAFEPARAEATYTIAATDYALGVVAAPFLAALKRRAPLIRVAFVPIADGEVESSLARGAIDLALMTPESAPATVHTRKLFDERYVCILREGHPALASGTLGLDRFCELDHALVSYSGGSFEGVTDVSLRAMGRRRRVSLSVKSFLALPKIIRTSDMIAVVPRRLVEGEPGLALVAPPLAIPGFTKVAAWHERTQHDEGQRWLRELLGEVMGAD